MLVLPPILPEGDLIHDVVLVLLPLLLQKVLDGLRVLLLPLSLLKGDEV